MALREPTSGFGEYALHDRISKLLNGDNRVVGDDAAVLHFDDASDVVVSVDRLSDRVPSELKPRLLVAQTLSDIIVVNGLPIAMLVALQMTPGSAPAEILEMVTKISEEARSYGASLIGGDTKEGSTPTAVGVGIGKLRPGGMVRRTGMMTGDLIAVTVEGGRKWGARWANHLVDYFDIGIPESLRAALKAKDYEIRLPVAESYAVIDSGSVTAGLDMSDGVGASALLLAKANSVGIDIWRSSLDQLVDNELTESVARELGLPSVAFAMSPGYMWNNMYAVSPSKSVDAIEAVRKTGGQLVFIGVAGEGPPEVTLDGELSNALNAASDEKFMSWTRSQGTAHWAQVMRELSI